MGLIVCDDCKREFSDRINNCPHCGCPKDVCIKNETMDKETEKTSSIVVDNEIKVKTDEFKMPSLRRSVTIIVLLLLLCFSQTMHPYTQEKELADLYDYAFVFGMVDLALLCVIEVVIPLIIGVLKSSLTHKHIKTISISYSVLVFGINLLLYVIV